jgi:hypothetical protein
MREAGPGRVSRHLSRASTRSGFPTMAGRGFSNVRERSWPKAGRPLPPVRSRGRRAAAQTRRKMGDVRLALPSSRPAGDTGMPQRFLGSRCGELCSEHPFHRVIVALHCFVKAAVSAYASSLHIPREELLARGPCDRISGVGLVAVVSHLHRLSLGPASWRSDASSRRPGRHGRIF